MSWANQVCYSAFMAKVYRVKRFDMDATPDNWIPGQRMATEEAAKRFKLDIDRNTGIQVDDSELDSEGMYPRKEIR